MFTYPHNAAFRGSLQEHMDYEKELHEIASDFEDPGKPASFISLRNNALYNWILMNHTFYIEGNHSQEDDIAWIYAICSSIAREYFYSRVVAVEMEKSTRIPKYTREAGTEM